MKLNLKQIRRFVRKELGWTVNFYSVQEYLHRQGYTVIFYNTQSGDGILKSLELSEYAKPINAFVYKTDELKIVFVSMRLSCEDKLYSLLHEAAHIYLNHIDTAPGISSKRLEEMEADTFAHECIRCSKKHTVLMSSLKTSVPAVLLSGAFFFGASGMSTKKVPAFITDTKEFTLPQADTVYVTPSGNKFHRPDCQYTKDKNCITFPRAEALKKYAPCSVCRP